MRAAHRGGDDLQLVVVGAAPAVGRVDRERPLHSELLQGNAVVPAARGDRQGLGRDGCHRARGVARTRVHDDRPFGGQSGGDERVVPAIGLHDDLAARGDRRQMERIVVESAVYFHGSGARDVRQGDVVAARAAVDHHVAGKLGLKGATQ
jgi:hypothetical protein